MTRGRPPIDDHDTLQLAKAIADGARIRWRAAASVIMWLRGKKDDRDVGRLADKLADAPRLPAGFRAVLKPFYEGAISASVKFKASVGMTVNRADGSKEEIPPKD
jgi:hypothetical protein